MNNLNIDTCTSTDGRNHEDHETSEKEIETETDAEGGYTPFNEIPYSNARLISATVYHDSNDNDKNDAANYGNNQNNNELVDGNEGGALFTFGKSSQVEDGYEYSFCNANNDFDDDDDDDDYDETKPHEEVFYANGYTEDADVDTDTDAGHEDTPMDFMAIAEQALQCLDLEYTETIKRDQHQLITPDPGKVDNTEHIETMELHATTGEEDKLQTNSESDTDEHALEDELEHEHEHERAPTKSSKIIPPIDAKAVSAVIQNISLATNLEKKFQKWNTNKRYTDTGTHTQKSESQQSLRQSQSQSHPIIPKKQLMSFQPNRKSDKAKSAAANLSRSATLAESINRLFFNTDTSSISTSTSTSTNMHMNMNIAMHRETYIHIDDEVFVIHCVGADRVECHTRDTISKAFAPIIKWIHQYQHFESGLEMNETSTSMRTSASTSDIHTTSTARNESIFRFPKHLRIELLGPNVPIHAQHFDTMNLLPTIPGRLETATVICKNCMYHDYLEDLETETCDDDKVGQSMKFPNLAIAYNAGIWGYTDWHPTLRKLNEFKRPVPFVITAYTLPEAEDDAEVLDEILPDVGAGALTANTNSGDDSVMNGKKIENKCLWTAEKNPYASRVVRETSSNDNIYFENGAWQALLMGKHTDTSTSAC